MAWVRAKECYEQSVKTCERKARISLLEEGQKYALQSVVENADDFESLRWAAVTTGTLTDFLGTKERIEQGAKFKDYLDKALAINSREYTLLHMRGRFAFSVAGLSWIERKAAAVLYSAPPTATYDEALLDFLAAYEERPEWIENLVYIGRCLIELKRKEEAKKFLEEAIILSPIDENEKELLQLGQKLISKL